MGNITRIEKPPSSAQEQAVVERRASIARAALVAAEKEREVLLEGTMALRKEIAEECRTILRMARFRAKQKVEAAEEKAAQILAQARKERDLAGSMLDEVTRREGEIAHGWEKLEAERARLRRSQVGS